MDQEYLLIAVALLTGIALAGTICVVVAPRLSRADPLARRLERIAAGPPGREGAPRSGTRGNQPNSIAQTLREIEEAQRRRGRPTLRLRLRQAGLGWSKAQYLAVCAGIALVVLLAGILIGIGVVPALGFGIGAGVGLPELTLRARRRRRLKQMVEEFPNAIDVIVRGVKSGLPLPDCLRIIAAEAAEPLRTEFAKVVRDQAVGLPAADAIDRFAERVPLSEASFFSIVITIQNQTGGSLAESLSNLSTVLRERKKMRAKIRALSTEATASAGIIGSLPPLVTLAIYLTSPDYMALLFDTFAGNLVIAGAVIWMSIGILVMRRMINLEI